MGVHTTSIRIITPFLLVLFVTLQTLALRRTGYFERCWRHSRAVLLPSPTLAGLGALCSGNHPEREVKLIMCVWLPEVGCL